MTLAYRCIKCKHVHRSDDVDAMYPEHYDMQDKKGVWRVSNELFNPVLTEEVLNA